jgi:N-acetyltransferase 10
VRQTSNDLTGENSSVVLRELNCQGLGIDAPASGWLEQYKIDYRRRLVSLMGFSFSAIEAPLAIALLDPDRCFTSFSSASSGGGVDGVDEDESSSSSLESNKTCFYGAAPLMSSELLSVHLSLHDMKRLELYSRNMVDHHMIVDLLPSLAKFVFLGRLRGFRLSYLQVAILLATGLQNRNVDEISAELELPANQVLAFFNKTIRKISAYLKTLIENHVAASSSSSDAVLQRMEKRAFAMTSTKESLKDDHQGEENEFKKKQKELLMKSKDLSKHAIVDVDISTLSGALDRSLKKQHDMPTSISVPKAASTISVGDNLLVDGHDNKSSPKHKKKKDKKRQRENDDA